MSVGARGPSGGSQTPGDGRSNSSLGAPPRHPVVPDISRPDGEPPIAGDAQPEHALGGSGGLKQRLSAMHRLAVVAVAVTVVLVIAIAGRGEPGGREGTSPAGDAGASGQAGEGRAGTSPGARAFAHGGDDEESRVVGSEMPPSDDHLALDSITSLFRSIPGDRSWSVAYPSPMGLQILSVAGVSQPDIEVAVGFEQSSRFPLITDGDQSWAVDPDDPETAYLVSTQFVVIDIDLDGRVGFINDSVDPVNIGESSYGAWGPGFNVPAGADVLPVPRRGLFVLPDTGGTYRYERNGVVAFSDDRLIAASIGAEIYRRCDERLTCELYLLDAQRNERALDTIVSANMIGPGTRYWPSPDGAWVIATSANGRSVIAGGPNQVEVPIGASAQAADWADDGTLVAVLTATELILVRPGESRMESATLPIEASAPVVLLVGTDRPS